MGHSGYRPKVGSNPYTFICFTEFHSFLQLDLIKTENVVDHLFQKIFTTDSSEQFSLLKPFYDLLTQRSGNDFLNQRSGGELVQRTGEECDSTQRFREFFALLRKGTAQIQVGPGCSGKEFNIQIVYLFLFNKCSLFHF